MDEADAFEADNLLKDDFLDLGNAYDVKQYLGQTESCQTQNLSQEGGKCEMEDWDQDVLLSNASLPEANPLLEMGSSVEDDFQKMLNEWENHIDALQTNELPQENNVQYILPCDEARASAGPVLQPADIAAEDSVSPPPDLASGGGAEPEEPEMPDPTAEELEAKPEKKCVRPCLAGIVISSGPGGHFETYEVLEASDPDQLLEHFEEAVGRRSQIMDAVRNHYSPVQSRKRQLPKVVPSHRIKDALPREVIDRIRANSHRSRTIAIIEPHGGNGKANATFDQLNSEMPLTSSALTSSALTSSALTSSALTSSALTSSALTSSALTSSALTSSASTSSALTSSALTSSASTSTTSKPTRFQDAASSLSKTKQYRQMGIIDGGSNVNLDHDYCSSVNKGKRRAVVSRRDAFTTFPRSVPIVVSSASRPYVKVSTGSRVVTASMLKPTPLTSASMLKSEGQQAKKVQRKVLSLPPKSKPSFRPKPAVVKLAPASSTKHEEKKDSGLESGEVSDSSGGGNDEDDRVYSRVPQYLTTVTVKNSDSYTVAEVDESDSYDRLPAYIKGVPKKVVIVRPSVEADAAASTSSSSSEASTLVFAKKRNRSSSTSSSCYSESDQEQSSKKPKKRRRMYSRSPPPPKQLHPQHKSAPSSEKRFGRERPNMPPIDAQRRVVYVGKVAEGTTRADLRKRFEAFGPIVDISVHFRDRGDDYGFVTFKYKPDACEAVEHGNDDPTLPKVDLCFGGRRGFCKEKYSDLDSSSPMVTYVDHLEIDESKRRGFRRGGDGLDFDALLQEARAGKQK